MSNINLFAPQVTAVQPAFIYDSSKKLPGGVKIYYSFSPYNEKDKEEVKKIGYKIIDPNLTSGWGTNSMIKNKEYLSVDVIKKGEAELGKYFTINFNETDYKILTLNQYYQVQIVFLGLSEEGNKEIEISPWSQITLIRPIEAHILSINEKDQDLFVFNKISGKINTEVETIKNYSFIILNPKNQKVYESDVIYNTLGRDFDYNIDNCFLEPEEENYTIKFKYVTLNGYESNENSFTFKILETDVSSDINVDISFDQAAAAVNFLIDMSELGLSSTNSFEIQRSSDINGFLDWQTLVLRKNMQLGYPIKWSDFTIENGIIYKYRIVYKDSNDEYKSYFDNNMEIQVEFEDIFLSTIFEQMAILYNPKISGLKWVTQESITNTLGGKFPIVRINGDTKYRQFSLTGTLYSNAPIRSDNNKDSRQVPMSTWIQEESNSFFFCVEDAFKYLQDEKYNNFKTNRFNIEKRFREKALDFLTNQNIKLFRSPTEGNILVYLSNISFTPNATLGRNVYDFSATLTEIDEFNIKNLEKYKLIYGAANPLFTYYVLKTVDVEEEGNFYLIPTVSTDFANINTQTLILEEIQV